MNILRIIYDWPPPWAGLAPHPYEITVAQAKLGHKITVFSGRWPKAGKLIEVKNTEISTIFREPFPGTISFTSAVLLFLKYIFWRRKNNPDIIHCHGNFAIWVYFYRLVLLKYFPWVNELKIPLVVHFHNTAKGRWEAFNAEDKHIWPHTKYIHWPMLVLSDRWALKAASASIFVSKDTRDEAIKFYNADPRRCFIVETGVNVEMFKPIGAEERERSRKELNLDIYDKIILNYGMMVERKNIHLIIEALKFLPYYYKLLLVGVGDKSYTQRLSQLIAASHLEDRVVRIGYTEYPQVPIACQMSDVFVLPSSWEGLPKVVMESLACGVPCVVSGFKVQEDIQGIYYLENNNPEEIAKKVKEVAEGQASVDMNTIKQKYSWDYKVSEIEGIYDFAQKNTLQ